MNIRNFKKTNNANRILNTRKKPFRIANFQRCVTLNRYRCEYEIRQLLLLYIKDHNHALKIITILLNQNSTNTAAYSDLGNDHESISIYNEILSTDPTRIDIFYNMASTFGKIHLYHKAISWIDKYIIAYPNHDEAIIFRETSGCSKRRFGARRIDKGIYRNSSVIST